MRDALLVGQHVRDVRRQFHPQRHPGLLIRRACPLDDVIHKRLHGDRLQFKRAFAAFQAGDLQQVIHDPEQAFRIIPRRRHKFALPGIQLSDALIEQHVQGHPDGRQGCLQFVRDGRDQVVFHFGNAPQPGHIHKHQDQPYRKAAFAANRNHPRQKEVLFAVHERPAALSARNRLPFPASLGPSKATEFTHAADVS